MDSRGNIGGIILNNMIYHAASKGSYADTGITLVESPNTPVYNNTIFMENSFPWAIEYRFASTSNILVVNNLTNKQIIARNDATGILVKNIITAIHSWFVNPSNGDLYLASRVNKVIGVGQHLTGLTDDYDGQQRSLMTGIDISADQYISSESSLLPPYLIDFLVVNP